MELPLPPEGSLERQEFQLIGNCRISAKGKFKHPIEVKLGTDEQTPTCYIIRYPSHQSHFDSYAVVQPEVACDQQGQGWAEFSMLESATALGRELSPQFRLGPEVSRRHCLVRLSVQEKGDLIEIDNFGRNGLRVGMHPDDLARQIEPFDPYDIVD